MDPTGSQLDSDFSQQDTPCLIIEDSQPESQVLEDNADSHFSVLSRHLPNLQIHKENPVLDIVSNPEEPAAEEQGDSNSSFNEHLKENTSSDPVDSSHLGTCGSISQVIEQLPQPNRPSSVLGVTVEAASLPEEKEEELEEEKEEVGANAPDAAACSLGAEDSASSQLGFGVLELSQSQDVEEHTVPYDVNQERLQLVTADSGSTELSDVDANTAVQCEEQSTDSTSLVELSKDIPVTVQPDKGIHVVDEQNLPSARSEDLPSGPEAPVAAVETKEQLPAHELLEGELQVQTSLEPEVSSTQEDLFEQSKAASDGCSTPSREEGGCSPVSTPATTLQLLQLSGQRPLVQDSLSTNSSDLVAPSPDAFRPTPFIVPSSPTEQGGRTVMPEEGGETLQKLQDDEASEIEKPPLPCQPAASPRVSTPVSQSVPVCTPGSLPIPSQPEFSHDIFIPSPSLEERSSHEKKDGDLHSSSLTVECSKTSESEPKNFTADLGLSLTGDSCQLILSTSEHSQSSRMESAGSPRVEGENTQMDDTEPLSPVTNAKLPAEGDNILMNPEQDGQLELGQNDGQTDMGDAESRADTDVLAAGRKGREETATEDVCIDLTCDSGSQAVPSPATRSEALSSVLDQEEAVEIKEQHPEEGFSGSEVEEVPETPCGSQREEPKEEAMESVPLHLSLTETQSQALCLQKEPPEEECPEAMEVETSMLSVDSPQKLPAVLDQELEHKEPETWEEATSEDSSVVIVDVKEPSPRADVPSEPLEGVEKCSDSQSWEDVAAEVEPCAENRVSTLEEKDAECDGDVKAETTAKDSVQEDSPQPPRPDQEMPQPQLQEKDSSVTIDAKVAEAKQLEPEGASQQLAKAPACASQSFCESSSETPFHFTLPKEGDIIPPLTGTTPPHIGHLKLDRNRHSTPIGE